MSKRVFSLVLIGLLLNLIFHTTVEANSEKEAKFAAKVKTEILKLGTGSTARIKLKLRDKTKLKGYVSDAGEDSFDVTNEKTAITTKVMYSQVRQVKGNNLSTGTIVAAGILILMVVGIIWGHAKAGDLD